MTRRPDIDSAEQKGLPMMVRPPASFERYLDELLLIWKNTDDTEERMDAARNVLGRLVVDASIQREVHDWPSTEGRGNLLLYEDQEAVPFILNAVVRTPGRVGGVHDHAHQWVLYGLAEGHESLERYERLDDGSDPSFAEVRLESVTQGGPGTVDLIPPYDVHRELGGEGRSVAIILRSERLRELQGRYDVENKVRTEGTHAESPLPIASH
jgi:predicted metal-dependent enzyme (double-stranded beta helix superfamily)